MVIQRKLRSKDVGFVSLTEKLKRIAVNCKCKNLFSGSLTKCLLLGITGMGLNMSPLISQDQRQWRDTLETPNYTQYIQYGVKGGLNAASLIGDDLDELESKIGVCLGLFLDYKINSKVGISGDLLFSQQGAYLEESDRYESYECYINMNYINLPVLFNFYPTSNLSLKVGLQPGMLMSAKEKVRYENEEYNYKKTETESFKKHCNSLDWSLPIGLSYTFDFGLRFDLRYNYGLNNIFKKGDDDIVNSVFQITIGYVIGREYIHQ